jgi:hypothetical protein
MDAEFVAGKPVNRIIMVFSLSFPAPLRPDYVLNPPSLINDCGASPMHMIRYFLLQNSNLKMLYKNCNIPHRRCSTELHFKRKGFSCRPASAVPESKRKLAPILCNHVAAVQARPYCNDLFVPQSYYNGYPGLNASAAMGIV